VWRRRSRPPAGREVRRSNDAAPVRAVLDEDAKDAASQTTLHPVPSASVRYRQRPPACRQSQRRPPETSSPATPRPTDLQGATSRSCAPLVIVARRLDPLQHHSHQFHRGPRREGRDHPGAPRGFARLRDEPAVLGARAPGAPLRGADDGASPGRRPPRGGVACPSLARGAGAAGVCCEHRPTLSVSASPCGPRTASPRSRGQLVISTGAAMPAPFSGWIPRRSWWPSSWCNRQALCAYTIARSSGSSSIKPSSTDLESQITPDEGHSGPRRSPSCRGAGLQVWRVAHVRPRGDPSSGLPHRGARFRLRVPSSSSAWPFALAGSRPEPHGRRLAWPADLKPPHGRSWVTAQRSGGR
jgi:hypothetical protein